MHRRRGLSRCAANPALMRRIETLIVLLALGFYAWFLRRFGWADVLHYVWMAGWGLVLTVSLEGLARLANTLGWRVTIENCPRQLGLGELFAARIAGEAVDYVTPSAQLGGQFVMAMMVRHKLRMAAGLVTVVVAALAEMLGQVGFITGGMLVVLPFEARFHHLLWPALGGLALAIALAVGFFYIQIKQPFSRLWRAAVHLDLSRGRRGRHAAARILCASSLAPRRFMPVLPGCVEPWSGRDLHPAAAPARARHLADRVAGRGLRPANRARHLHDSRQAGQPGRRQGAGDGSAGLSGRRRLCGGVVAPV